MPIRRIYLGLERAPLVSAADYLFASRTPANPSDLGKVIVVVPGRRAGRRLMELLVERAEQVGGRFEPPHIETLGSLPEKLYEQKKPFAEELVQRLAWVEALRAARREVLATIAPVPPDRDDVLRWLELADLLRRLHTELAADGLDFEAVADRGEQIRGFTERGRWSAIAEVQDDYLARLDALELWDVQTARLYAVQHKECRTDREIVLAGTVDMNLAQRDMLDLVADQAADRVTALVFAPQAWSDRFDDHGCLRPEAWQHLPIDLVTDQVRVVDGPADQAAEVVRRMAEFNGRFRGDEVTIGMPDEQLVPDVRRTLEQAGIRARWGPGASIAESGPYRLLVGVAAVLQGSRFADYAALMRHPDVVDWLQSEGEQRDWLTELDSYHEKHLPARLTGRWLGADGDWPALRSAFEKLRGWLSPLEGERRPLDQWTDLLLESLRQVYGRRVCRTGNAADRATLRACGKLHAVLESYADIPESLMPSLAGPDAIQLTLQRAASELVPPPEDPDAVEMLGWLELAWDDAPALIVTGMNEGIVPNSVNSDIFLPNALRTGLKLEDNARRYARDAYALNVLLATRRELRLIAGRRTADQSPLIPSRLLFAAEGETIARRVQAFLRPSQEAPMAIASNWPMPRDEAGFEVPRPEPLAEPLSSLAVTDFRRYLACPYRFYLERILRLQPLRDGAEELDGAAFGNLLHDVLQQFGRGEARDATSAETIRRVLDEELDRQATARYGSLKRTTVAVQIEQLRLRLRAFAERQAEWASQGWRIKYTEVPRQGATAGEIVVDGQPMGLRGRIDRVDLHSETGECAILDYKSSDAGRTPDKTHRKAGGWIDLQLPLYRHLARGLELPEPIKVGYVTLPKDSTAGAFCLAEWTPDELAEADQVAAEVVRAVRRQQFWPPTTPPPEFSESLAPICQDNVFDSWLERHNSLG